MRNRSIRGLALVGTLSVLVGLLGPIQIAAADETASGGSLDGKTYVGMVCKKGATNGENDTLVFKEGQFRSEACDKYGFGSAPYTVTTSGDSKSFDATTESERGTLVWHGTVTGDEVAGTTTFHRKKTWYSWILPTSDEKDFKAKLKE